MCALYIQPFKPHSHGGTTLKLEEKAPAFTQNFTQNQLFTLSMVFTVSFPLLEAGYSSILPSQMGTHPGYHC